MSIEQLAFPVEDLTIGMYVSSLDRPWIETPFLFQGFLIESHDEIAELQSYCEFVYVDVERGDRSLILPNGQRAAPKTKPSRQEQEPPQRSAKARSTTLSSHAGSDDDTAILKAEIKHAREAHGAAERTIQNLLTKVRSGEDIDASGVQKSLDPMIDSIMRNDDAMSWLARMKKKDDYIYDHSIASSIWAMIFGKHLGLDKRDLEILGTGAVFLDVGKTRIPNELLVKSEKLTPEELQLLRRHVEFGVEIVSKIDGIDPRVIEMIAGHHERYNGTGYPKGLSKTEIPVFARIAGIVDTYDAMTTLRPYAKPKSTYDAIRQLNTLAGVEFPEEVVEQFIQAIGVFPVGTMVELNTGEVGIVIAQNRVRRLRPKVMLLLDENKSPLVHFKIVDLRNQLSNESGDTSLWIEQGLAPGDYGLDPSEYYL
jgi:HD-GYP domain-containing protein (c-di-GMP phosphodiesterase class II)